METQEEDGEPHKVRVEVPLVEALLCDDLVPGRDAGESRCGVAGDVGDALPLGDGDHFVAVHEPTDVLHPANVARHCREVDEKAP